MLRLTANKTKLYKLVADYETLPPMSRVTFTKAHRRPEYWLEWSEFQVETGDLRCKAYFAAIGGRAKLLITKRELGGQKVAERVYTVGSLNLKVRKMLEEFIPAKERYGVEAEVANGTV